MPYYDDYGSESAVCWMVIMYILSVVLCIYSFVTANATNGEYNGTLMSAHVAQYNSKYYVVETFAKGFIDGMDGNGTLIPSNHTCGIRRLHSYADYMYASNMADAVIIGTTRKIWESYNDPGRCYDETLRNFWNLIGGLSIIIAGLPFVIVIILCIDLAINEWIWTTQPSPVPPNRLPPAYSNANGNNENVV